MDAIRVIRGMSDEELAQLAGSLKESTDPRSGALKALVVNELERRLGVVLS